MNKQPLVSVIIPSFGGAQFLTRCINSVLNQTYTNIEIIVVDDNGIGTKEQLETAEIITQYKSKDNIKYICHEKNINGSAARNTGFKHSKGEYIALLDDDDVFLYQKIQRQVELLHSLPSEFGAVYCSHETFLNEKKVGEEHAIFDGNFLYEYMTHKIEIASSSILIRRCVWEKIGGFDETFKRHQDWEFISRILSKYAIKSDDFMGFERILQFRNSRVSPKVVKERRIFYLEKKEPLIKSFSHKRQQELIASEYFDIALHYLKAKDCKGFIEEISSIKPKILGIKLLINKAFSFLKRGGKIIK